MSADDYEPDWDDAEPIFEREEPDCPPCNDSGTVDGHPCTCTGAAGPVDEAAVAAAWAHTRSAGATIDGHPPF